MIDFKNLPLEIKDWISSDEITTLIRDLENRLSIPPKNIGVTADIVYDVVTQALAPQNVKSELKKAGLSDDKTEIATREIKERLLSPIRASLQGNLNVDIELIAVSSAGSRPSIVPIPTVVNLKNQPPRPPSGMEIRPQDGNNEPFIIHRENPDLRPFIQTPPPGDAAKHSTPDASPEIKTGESERIVHYSGPVTKIGEERKAP